MGTTYFCTRCKKSLEKHERLKFGKGGVCKACHDHLSEGLPKPMGRVFYLGSVELQDSHLADIS